MEERMMYCKKGHKMIHATKTTVPDQQQLKIATCRGCARSYSSSQSKEEALFYTCSDCESAEWAMIHRKCAELPKKIHHPIHAKHPLVLLTKPPYQNETCECQACKKPWRNFVYHCSVCEFDIDILCAFSEEEIEIPTHHHRVRLMRRPASFICNACNAECDKEESYICTQPSCLFWIHKRCGLLQEVFEHPEHDHPLRVDISVPVRYRKYKLSCEVCHDDLRPSDWVYYCWRCKFFIHFKCITEKCSVGWDAGYSDRPRLEMIRDLKTVMYHTLPEDEEDDWCQHTRHEVKVDGHEHSLILNRDKPDDEQEIVCDGCIVPIDDASVPYYKCGQNCGFFLHTTCAIFPIMYRELEAWNYHDICNHSAKLKLHFPKNPWEVVKCKACNSDSNGFGYKCSKSSCDAYWDIKCFFLMGMVKHMGHKHDLSAGIHEGHERPVGTTARWYTGFIETQFQCGGCGVSKMAPFAGCGPCKFRLGYECSTLPATVKHRWDKHPLVLSFPPFFRDVDQDDDFFCEVCEEELHPRHWAYRCAKCDQSFHPRCVPTLGESRNIKFGATVTVKHHPHPLTFVPQAKLSGRCHECCKSVYWSRSFECAPCGFYVCRDCMVNEELVIEPLPGSSTTAYVFIE